MPYDIISSQDPLMDGAKVYKRKITKEDHKLCNIAAQYGRDEDALAALNNLADKNVIIAGKNIDVLLNKNKTEGVEDEYIELSQLDTNDDGYIETFENLQRYINNQNNNTEGPKIQQDGTIWGKKASATFTSDGSLTYKELSENLGVPLDKLLPDASTSADDTIPEGAKILIGDTDLPEFPIVPGVTQSAFGTRLYINVPDDALKDTSTMSDAEIKEYKEQLIGKISTLGNIVEGYDVDDLKINNGRIMLYGDRNLLGYYK